VAEHAGEDGLSQVRVLLLPPPPGPAHDDNLHLWGQHGLFQIPSRPVPGDRDCSGVGELYAGRDGEVP
jgi:hypothetical protein